MIRTLSALALLLAWAGTADAYDLRAKSESVLTSAPELAQLVKTIGDQVGQNIPQSDQVRVHVFSEARPRENGEEILYDHRIELRKLFNSRNQGPYPMAGWLVIHTSETYGIGTEQKARAELEHTIRQFFEDLRRVDPKTQSP